MAKGKYVQVGHTIDYTNSGSTKIDAGTIVSLTTRIGVVGMDIAAGATGVVDVVGVFSLPKATGAIALGAKVYYNTTDENITTTSTDVPAGYAVAAAASAATSVLVQISQ